LGHRPYYVEEEGRAALVLIRSLEPFGFFLSRAIAHPSNADLSFIHNLLTLLKNKNVCFVKIGDTMQGPADKHSLTSAQIRPVERHTFLLDLNNDEDALFRNMKRPARNRIRKTEKEGVRAYEVADIKDVEKYAQLSKTTSDRIRSTGSIMEMPKRFFVEIFDRMIKKDMAKLIVAAHNGRMLAGILCFIHRDRMLAYHAASTRDRSLTALHGPTVCFWHAIKTARALGLKTFDFGGCTPGLPKSDSRYGVYFFKSQWGGRLETFYNGEAVLSKLGYRFQESILKRVWHVAHPLYFKLRGSLRGT
jgi:lipid II:glycine glycyltransferase (peptidoglycan interpeptide bridge formation enzyme)